MVPRLAEGNIYLHSLGYPPADHDVRNYLCAEDSSSHTVFTRACAFLAALFNVTTLVLVSDPDSVPKPVELPPINLDADVAGQFRAYMSAGTTMAAHGRFRQEFYKKVVDRAKRVVCLGYEPRRDDLIDVNNTGFPSLRRLSET
jgi:hypothetical protein